jgi:hypothetical protein
MNILPVPWVEPSDVSNAVVWLSSDQARYVTGTALPVDAGAIQKQRPVRRIGSSARHRLRITSVAAVTTLPFENLKALSRTGAWLSPGLPRVTPTALDLLEGRAPAGEELDEESSRAGWPAEREVNS